MFFSKSKRECIFCGNKSLTNEHIYPKWLFQIVKLDTQTFKPTNFDIVIASTASSDTLLVNNQYSDGREIRYDDFKTKYVCGTCNNEWMSKLENLVKPIIEKIYQDNTYDLKTDEAYNLSLWAITKIIVIGYAVEAPYTFDLFIREMLKENIIPEGFIVEFRKMDSHILTWHTGNISPVLATRIEREQIELALENFFTAALQIGEIGLRITYLRTSIPVQRTQINEKLLLLYPFNGKLPFIRADGIIENPTADLKDTEIPALCNSITLCDKLYS